MCVFKWLWVGRFQKLHNRHLICIWAPPDASRGAISMQRIATFQTKPVANYVLVSACCSDDRDWLRLVNILRETKENTRGRLCSNFANCAPSRCVPLYLFMFVGAWEICRGGLDKIIIRCAKCGALSALSKWKSEAARLQ